MFSMTRFAAAVAAVLVASACGGGNPVTPIEGGPGTFTVAVFAGAPVVGASVHVLAIDPATGKALTNRPDNGVLGSSEKPTDEKGVTTVKVKGYSGFVQIVAAGGGYLDPMDPKTTVEMPGTLQLTSYLGLYKAGTDVSAPVSFWTTLADAAAHAYALGLNPYSPSAQTIPNSMAVTDTLFAHHVDPKAAWSVRSVLPAPFSGPQTWRDTSAASLGDVALNALAAKIGGGATGFGVLAALLEDLEADGQFDGYTVKSGSTVPVTLASTTFSAETTRGELAHALDAYATSSANLSGLTRATFVGTGVYEAMALDASLLYPADVQPPPWVLEGPPGQVTAVVSAGAPVVGATVKVFAVDSASGQVLVERADQGLLGTAGPTDSGGRVTVALETPFSGAIQVVATLGSYGDPSDTAVSITMGESAQLTSFVGEFTAGSEITVPVTSWTTLADAAAQAYALGRNAATAGKACPLSEALGVVDPLVQSHVDHRGVWTLRATQPAGLGNPLTAGAIATLAELALHQLARNVAATVGAKYPDEVSSATLVGLLVGDLAADGQFDGRAENGALISVPGPTKAEALTTETTRGVLARALDAFMQSPRNGSSVKRAQLEAADVYQAIALDRSALYPAAVAPPTFTLASLPPSIEIVSSPKWSTVPTATIVVNVTDNSGSGIQKVLGQIGTATPVAATLQVDDGTYALEVALRGDTVSTEIAIWAVDNLANSGVEGDYARQAPYYVVATVGLDNTPPTISISPVASYLSEQDLALTSETVPPVYTYKSTAKAMVDESHLTVFKASSRLSYGPSAPTVAELTTTNAYNTPFIRFAVPYVPTDGAPILTPKYTVTRTDSQANPPEAQLLGDPKSAVGGVVYFYLPLSRETLFPGVDPRSFPSIGTSFRVKVSVGDEAGNTNTVDFPTTSSNDTFEYAFTSPPLHLAKDANYAASNDASSAFSARVSDMTYTNLWAHATPLRYARYVVSNPAPVAVVADVSIANASVAFDEHWPIEVTALPAHHTEQYRGWTLVSPTLFNLYGCVNATLCPPEEVMWSWPCGLNAGMCSTGASYQRAFSGPRDSTTSAPFKCHDVYWDESEFGLNYHGTTEANTLGVASFQYKGDPTFETTAMPAASYGDFVVPAASGAVPGRVVVYVVRPSTSARPAALPTLAVQSWSILARPSWATWLYDSWRFNGVKTTEYADGVEGCYHTAYRHYERLTDAQDTATYTLSYSTVAAAADGVSPVSYFTGSITRSESSTVTH